MSKYFNLRAGQYASKREAARAAELEMLERAGVIANLVKQPTYILIPKDELGRAVIYQADFAYQENGKLIVEDVKSEFTKKLPVYRLKRRLLWYVSRIKIVEV